VDRGDRDRDSRKSTKEELRKYCGRLVAPVVKN